MTRVALISDTHNHLPDEAITLMRGADHIIHAGDICEPRILWELECIAPVTAVLGNNDYADFGPAVNAVAKRVIDGFRFVVSHRPEDLRCALRSLDRSEGLPVIGIYGHKHVPHLDIGSHSQQCDILVSPGSVFRSREPMGTKTIALLDIDAGRLDAKVIDLKGNEMLALRWPA